MQTLDELVMGSSLIRPKAVARAGQPPVVAREKAQRYLWDKVLAILVCCASFPAGVLFLLGSLGLAGRGGPPVLLLASAIGTLAAGFMGFLFLISRYRLTVFEDHMVIPESVFPRSAAISFRELKALELKLDRGVWECSLETLDGRKVSFSLLGLDFPDAARRTLSRVAASLEEHQTRSEH